MLLYSGRVDGYVPVQTGVTEDEGDDNVSIISDGQYIYRRRNGSAANIYHYTLADYFFDATLAPAERDGKWVYPCEPQRKIRPAGSRRGRICPLHV